MSDTMLNFKHYGYTNQNLMEDDAHPPKHVAESEFAKRAIGIATPTTNGVSFVNRSPDFEQRVAKYEDMMDSFPYWEYDNSLLVLYRFYDKNIPYKISKDNYNNSFCHIYEVEEWNLYVLLEFRGKVCDVSHSISIRNRDHMLYGYEYQDTISTKLANSFLRYFKGKANRIDKARLEDYYKKHVRKVEKNERF